MRLNLEDILNKINIDQFKNDYYIFTAPEMQKKYNLSEYYYFKVVHALLLQRRINNYTLEELCTLISKEKYLELRANYTKKEIQKLYNLSNYQLSALQEHYEITFRKKPQTYEDFKNTINLKDFIKYAQSGNTDYSRFLKTKNNRFINQLLKELNIKKRLTKQELFDRIDKEQFIIDFKNYSLQALAEKYETSITTIKNLQKSLGLARSSKDIFRIKEQTAFNNAHFKGTMEEFRSMLAQKVAESKKEKGTISTSKVETYFSSMLKQLFGEDKVLTQIKTKKYPYYCDIYIKPLELYLEINGHYTHGYHPFDSSNLEDIKQLDQIKQKQQKYLSSKGTIKQNSYFTWEKVWTKKDPEKLKAAIKNNLNYIVIYMDKQHNLQIYLANPKLDINYYSNLFTKICLKSDYNIKGIYFLNK